jgi:biotin carboxyl carrier protein
MKYLATVNGRTYTIDILPEGKLVVNDKARSIDFLSLDEKSFYSLLVDGASYEGLVHERDGAYEVLLWGALYQVQVMDEREQRLAKSSAGFVPQGGEIAIRAPMPGLIVDVPVEVGQDVKAGQTLVILESMKMENELKAPRDGKVHALNVKAGQNVEQNKTLVSIT